jgi:hypothetical protein
VSCWLKSGGDYQREQRKSTCSLKERRVVSPDSFSRQEDRISRISRINKSGFRKRRTPQNDPIGFALIHSRSVLSVSFDSLRSLLRSCLRQSISLWSVVVNSSGFRIYRMRCGRIRCTNVAIKKQTSTSELASISFLTANPGKPGSVSRVLGRLKAAALICAELTAAEGIGVEPRTWGGEREVLNLRESVTSVEK